MDPANNDLISGNLVFSRYTRVKQDNAALTARIHMLEEHIRELEVLCFYFKNGLVCHSTNYRDHFNPILNFLFPP